MSVYRCSHSGIYVEVRGKVWELVLPFNHVGPRDKTRVMRFGKSFYPESHLAHPCFGQDPAMCFRLSYNSRYCDVSSETLFTVYFVSSMH